MCVCVNHSPGCVCVRTLQSEGVFICVLQSFSLLLYITMYFIVFTEMLL